MTSSVAVPGARTATNWAADGIWSQHVLSGFWASGTGGTARNNRLTSI